MGKTPLPWQLEAAEKAANENLIVFAETGSGKTLVAELAIKEALKRQPLKKCAFFVTATRLLAHQQWQRILESLKDEDGQMTALEVTGYTTAEWGRHEWRSALGVDTGFGPQVLVGTIETFARACIDHGYVDVGDFSLVVVDECHKAVGDSPGAELLRWIASDESSRPMPRVLGLTASYANDGAKTWDEFSESLHTLQAMFCAKMHVCTVPERKKPQFEKIEYVPSQQAVEAKTAAVQVCQTLWHEVRQANLKEPKEAERLAMQLVELLTELGRDAFEHGVEHGIVAQINGRIDNYSKIVEQKKKAEHFQGDLQKLKQSLGSALEVVKAMESLRSFYKRSPKLEALVRCLQAEFQGDVRGEAREVKSCGMVFVSQVALALPLAKLLGELLPVAVGAVSGVTSMREKERNDALTDFRVGRTRLLVCTMCAEEGLDVADCSFVVRFNQFHTTRSHVQGVGRARAQEARVYYFDNCPSLECERAEVMKVVAIAKQDEAIPSVGTMPWYCQRSTIHPFKVPGSMAEVNFRSAQRILSQYLSVASGGASFKRLYVDAENGEDGELLLPGPDGGLKLKKADACKFVELHSTPVEVKAALKYVAVLALHSRGWLDKHNCVPKRIERACGAWKESYGSAQDISCLHLRFMVSGCHPQLAGGGRQDREGSSGLEQVDLGREHLEPQKIENTQLTVNTTFSCGASVMAAMAALVDGRQRVEDFPLIRVAWNEKGQKWYSADNRRLFIYKVVAPLISLQQVEVAVINWTSEFDCKTSQIARQGKVWATHEKSVEQVRSQLLEALASGDDLGRCPEPLPKSAGPEDQARSLSILRQCQETLPLTDAGVFPTETHRPKARGTHSSCQRAEVKEVEMRAAEGSIEMGPEIMLEKGYQLPEHPSRNISRLEGELPFFQADSPQEEPRRPTAKAQDETTGSPAERAAVPVIHGGTDEADDLLRRVGQTLAKNAMRHDEEAAVTLLKEVMECHCRLKDKEQLPLEYDYEIPTFGKDPKGFQGVVLVAGRRFVAAVEAPTKKQAKKKAALMAITNLARATESQSQEVSPRSAGTEESWQMLEDYEMVEAAIGHSENLRVELVLEPDHAMSHGTFRPKPQLLEYLQGLLGMPPTSSQCRFVFKGGERFWRCRVELHLPQLSGSFEGIPAEAQEQAEQNAAWRVLEKLKLVKVAVLHPSQKLQDALRTLPNSENLELVQDGCVISGELQVSQMSCLRFEVRDAEPW